MTALLNDEELLARLVAFDTTSHRSNRPLAEFVADYLDRPGVEILRHTAPEGDKCNLVVFVGPPVDAKERAGLILSGHMDVVPALEPEWQSDPFQLLDTGETLVGRGSSDMKGFVALAVNRAARLDPTKMKRPLVLLLTYDEEVGTVGAHHFQQNWAAERPDRPLPKNALIGEPTHLKVVRMHKGHLKMRVTFRGVPAHSGYPHLGVNAIEPAGRVITALSDLRRQLEKEAPAYGEFFPEVPYVALNIAQVRGGVAVNVVPEGCTLDIGARVLPGMESGELMARVRHTVEGALAGETIPFEVTLEGDSPPLLLSEEAPLCRHLCTLTGQEGSAAVNYATDAGWFQEMDMDCVICGPGAIEVAHKPNEFVEKAQLQQAGELVDRLVAESLGS
jgi:acetylornithine deacetylase